MYACQRHQLHTLPELFAKVFGFLYVRFLYWLHFWRYIYRSIEVVVTFIYSAGKHVQRRFPSPVSSRATDQAAPTGLYNSDTTLDICAEFQSLTLRVPSHRDAFLHLCHHRDAGLYTFLLKLLLCEFNMSLLILMFYYTRY